MIYAEIHVTRQFFEANSVQGQFFEKNIFRFAQGECDTKLLVTIIGLVGSEGLGQTNK